MAKPGKKSKGAKRDPAGVRVKPKKAPPGKQAAVGASAKKAAADVPQLPIGDAADEATALARITQLEADRTNLMAQVAWARGIASEQQKALEAERSRTQKLEADLETQRARIEQLKALGTLDRLLGRHKNI